VSAPCTNRLAASRFSIAAAPLGRQKLDASQRQKVAIYSEVPRVVGWLKYPNTAGAGKHLGCNFSVFACVRTEFSPTICSSKECIFLTTATDVVPGEVSRQMGRV